MSLFQDKAARLSDMAGNSISSVPLKYTELIRKHQEESASNAVNTLSMTITNLYTQEDYDNISKALQEVKGVVGVGSFQQPKKLTVSYNQYQTSIEHIVYKISTLGYRYINRF